MIADELLRRAMAYISRLPFDVEGAQLALDLRNYINEYIEELPPIEEAVVEPKVAEDDIEEQRAYVDRTLDWLWDEMPRQTPSQRGARDFIMQLRVNCETNNYHVRLLYKIINAFNEGVDRSWASLWIGIDEAGQWNIWMARNERVPVGRDLTLNYF